VGRSKLNPGDPVQHAFLWENCGPMVDLNTLIPPNSPLLLEEGGNINDLGEIAGRGVPTGCDDVDACGHAFLLVPCVSDVSCESKGNVPTVTVQQRGTPIATRPPVSPRAPAQILSGLRTKLSWSYTAP